MSKSTYIVSLFVAALVGVVVGYSLTHQDSAQLTQVASPAGSTYSNAPIAEQSLVVSSSTVYSVLNGDAVDRLITSFDMFAIGGAATSSNYTMQCATSSTAFTPTNTNLILNQAINPLGTTTGGVGFYVSSTSPGISGAPFGTASTTARIWPTQTYLVCSSTDSVANTNSANTLDSNTTGFLNFRFLRQ